ncbi:MAG: VWA domain-containing protein [Clostridiales bacterium]|nr:VWA domain-containing protein [Clostridiales bacterium]
MKKTKAISLLLCLSLLASLLIPGTLAMPAKAAEGDTDNGMKISKTAEANDDGTYTITLEAYATGEKFISEVKKDVPTDIILVLDQSGSMKQTMNTYDFRAYSNMSNINFYNVRYNQEWENGRNLYYKQDDESYATVSVTVTPGVTYSAYGNATTNYYYYYYYSNNLYAKVDSDFKQVTVSQEGDWSNRYYVYKIGEVEIARSQGRNSSPDFTGIDGNVLYYPTTDESKNVYTYTYTDQDGVTQTIGTSTGANTKPTDFTLYERYQSGSITKLQALKNAVTTLETSVAEKAKGPDKEYGTADDVDHRIAVVGFACSNTGNNNNYNKYQNTEVFIGSNQYKYGTAAEGQYKVALQKMTTQAGRDNVTASISALAADGATYVNHGIEMANGILNANPIPANEKRNRVVVVFTDGVPGYSEFESGVANSAITQASTTKSLGANVYAVGVFSGADATSAGNQNGSDTQKANWFMQKVSSNNGTPQTPSYYLSAADANTLNNIFKQISDQIETGGSSTTLDASAVVKDIIAPAFSLPADATAENITLETYSYTGENKWTKNSGAMGATATVNGDQVSVTGFNFAENYVGTVTESGKVSYRGNKLVISFTVAPKAGFLGGNNVYTNTSAGVYVDSSATEPVKIFPKPQVNVPIKDVTVTAQDRNVYLLGSLSAADIQSGATVMCGEVSLDLSKADENYGLQDWQTEYVDITVEIKDKDGHAIPADGLNDLREDTTYTVSVTVAPKNNGTNADGTPATAKSGVNKPPAKINVFKPVLTYKDSEVYYGDNAPTDFSANKTPEVWKHDDTLSTDNGVNMIGTAPPLSITYTPEAGKIADGKINTKQDIAVDATVKIDTTDVTDNTVFEHTNCEGKACNVPEGKAFLLHVKTCQLTITKTGGADGEPYVFTVMKDGKEYSEVTIVGNGNATIVELPVGTYSIEEDTGWSWRYTGDNGNGASLTARSPSDTITCTNSNSMPYWLNGYSDVVTNIFGFKH